MQQALLLTRSIEIAQASKTQVSSMRNCIEHLSRDPRVKTIYGISGNSTGWAALCEFPVGNGSHEAERLAALAQVYGQTNVEVIPLLPPEQLRAGLEEAERVASAGTQASMTPGSTSK